MIGVIENQAPTKHLTFDVQLENGEIKVDMQRDIAKVALVERHKGTGRIMMGLVSGFGFTSKCAIASTVAHDCHHMIVIGTHGRGRIGNIVLGSVASKVVHLTDVPVLLVK